MDDSNLIFLISQPRSGSSLLQQVLLNNPLVTAKPEPWLMLQLVYVYKRLNYSGGYNPNFGHIALMEYLEGIPDGLTVLKRHIKACAKELYSSSRVQAGGFFLDKTPRYYHIINELVDLFPGAGFIFLVRNPLAVFASILNYNFGGNVGAMLSSPDRQADLFLAPKLISGAGTLQSTRTIFVKYEDVVAQKRELLLDVERTLGLRYERYAYAVSDDFTGTTWIDGKSVGRHTEPVPSYVESWREHINSAVSKYHALSYLDKLGEEMVRQLGYDFSEIRLSLVKHRVPGEFRFSAKKTAKAVAKAALRRLRS